jgi:hypothetical protein
LGFKNADLDADFKIADEILKMYTKVIHRKMKEKYGFKTFSVCILSGFNLFRVHFILNVSTVSKLDLNPLFLITKNLSRSPFYKLCV